MPTEEEWEGMGRKVDMAERKNIQAEADFIRTTPAGQLIAREAFKEGIEAAAAYHDKEARWWRADVIGFGLDVLALRHVHLPAHPLPFFLSRHPSPPGRWPQSFLPIRQLVESAGDSLPFFRK